MTEKKIIFSGIQPSGSLTLGNYIGAMMNWSRLQRDDTYCYYCVVDQHAITIRQNSDDLRRRSLETAALILAAGIDPERSTLFIQSQVPQHSQLAWVLNCNTYMGELNRMTQFKEKSARHNDNINAGLFTYPVLQAADILLYQTHLVPVGHDQKQHIEISRDIAIRFNNAYGEAFVIPEPSIPEFGGKVMSLQEPDKKMSKSDANPNAYIAIMDEPETIIKKFKRAVTDSENCIAFDENRPGVSNLLSIYCTLTGKPPQNIESEFKGFGYGQLKTAVAEAVVEELAPIQTRFKKFVADVDYLKSVLEMGRKRAVEAAQKTVEQVYELVGF